MNASKTHKIKHTSARASKNELWTKLESLIAEHMPDSGGIDPSTATAAKPQPQPQQPHGMECVYNPSGNREVCDVCQSNLVITEDGFATCTNPKCSIIYKDSLDYSAEWRFYGADDNQMTDPTRCGMPVNPLLLESSYGCKVI